MALETASYVANLVVTNPDGSDARSTADDHLRLVKASLVRTFPKLDSAVSLSATQISYVGDLSASVQLQFNALRDGPATANFAAVATNANQATLALTANSASFATLAGHAQSASYAANAGQADNATTADSADSAAAANFATTAGSAATATEASHAASASFATAATTASNALQLSSANLSVALAPSTVVGRNGDGDIFANYLRQATGAETPSVGHVACMRDLDGAWRVTPVDTLGSYLNGRNISNKSGTTKTLASGSGPPSLVGSTNGDIWFYY